MYTVLGGLTVGGWWVIACSGMGNVEGGVHLASGGCITCRCCCHRCHCRDMHFGWHRHWHTDQMRAGPVCWRVVHMAPEGGGWHSF